MGTKLCIIELVLWVFLPSLTTTIMTIRGCQEDVKALIGLADESCVVRERSFSSLSCGELCQLSFIIKLHKKDNEESRIEPRIQEECRTQRS